MRTLDRVLLAVLGLALTAGGTLGVLEALLALMDRPGAVVDRSATAEALAAATWSDPTATAVAGWLLAVGLVLLALELKPRRPDAYPAEGADDYRVRYGRHGVARFAEQVVERHDDVAATPRVTLRRRRLRVEAEGYADVVPDQLERELASLVEDRVADLDLGQRLRASVRVRRGERRAR